MLATGVPVSVKPEVLRLWAQLAALESSLLVLHQRLAAIPSAAAAPARAEPAVDWLVAYR